MKLQTLQGLRSVIIRPSLGIYVKAEYANCTPGGYYRVSAGSNAEPRLLDKPLRMRGWRVILWSYVNITIFPIIGAAMMASSVSTKVNPFTVWHFVTSLYPECNVADIFTKFV